MTTRLDTLGARYGELVPTAALSASGLNSTAIDGLLRDGTLVRIRRGMFVWGPLWRESDPDDRYRLFVRASAESAVRPLVLSHISAAALHGLPYIGLWPREVHSLNVWPSLLGGSTTSSSNTRCRGRRHARGELSTEVRMPIQQIVDNRAVSAGKRASEWAGLLTTS